MMRESMMVLSSFASRYFQENLFQSEEGMSDRTIIF